MRFSTALAELTGLIILTIVFLPFIIIAKVFDL